MIQQFHQDSRVSLLSPPTSNHHMYDIARRLKVRAVNRHRLAIRMVHDQEWHIYELCKAMADLAAYDKIDCSIFTFKEWASFVDIVAPYTDPEALTRALHTFLTGRIDDK